MCCGKKRATLATQSRGMAQPSRGPEPEMLAFQYVGDTSLTATGSITGKTYRFAAKGAIQLVHRQDASRLRDVPNLIQVD